LLGVVVRVGPDISKRMVYTSSGTTFKVHIRVLCIYPQKEILPDLTKKVKKNKIQMISSIRVHPMGCWEGGHMTNCLKW